MKKSRSILSALVLILCVLTQYSKGAALTEAEIASDNVQAILVFGTNQIIQVSNERGRIPVSDYSITAVNSVLMEVQNTRTSYQCNATLGDSYGAVIRTAFFVYVSASTQAMTIGSWSTSSSNLNWPTPTLTEAQIARTDVQAVLDFGANQIVQIGNERGRIPVSDYSITTVNSVVMQNQTTRIIYNCNVTLGNVYEAVIRTTFTVTVNTSTQAMTLGAWSYSTSNLQATTAANNNNTITPTTPTTNTTNTTTTPTTPTTNTTTPNNTTTNPSTGTNTGSSELPEALIANMSLRATRYHHYIWHQIRNNWNRWTEEQKSAFTELGWAPPRPSLGYNEDGSSYVLTDNDSGQDFLYMHRQMIAQAKELAGSAQASVSSWATIPAPGDSENPVPDNYTIPGNTGTTSTTTNRKTDAYYYDRIQPWEETFTDPAELRRMTLGQFGARIEFTIHNALHMRFSAASDYGYRSSYSGIVPYINTQWDNSSYSWMGDLYASHVHPVFWKIHGWVNDRIDDWMAANSVREIVWNGTWVGGPMSSFSSVLDRTRLLRGDAKSQSKPMGDMEGMGDMSGDCDVLDKVMEVLINMGDEEVDLGAEVDMEDFVPEKYKHHEPARKDKDN